MQVNGKIPWQKIRSKFHVGQKRKLFEETTASTAQLNSVPPTEIRQNQSKVHVGRKLPIVIGRAISGKFQPIRWEHYFMIFP